MTEIDLLDHIEPVAAPEGVKLGAHVGIRDPRIPLLARHTVPGVTVPSSCHRSDRALPYGMLANDRVGDCVIAEGLHGIQHRRKGAGLQVPTFTDQQALDLYSAITGYNPGNPNSDQGTDPNEAYAYWIRTGVKLPDGTVDKLAGCAQIRPADGANIRRGIWEFDCLGLSINLPATAQSQTIWDVVGDPSTDPDAAPGSWGGHQVLGVSYDSQRIAFVTWGMVMLMTWRFWGTYGELALAGLSHDLINKTGVSETGLNYASLAADMPAL